MVRLITNPDGYPCWLGISRLEIPEGFETEPAVPEEEAALTAMEESLPLWQRLILPGPLRRLILRLSGDAPDAELAIAEISDRPRLVWEVEAGGTLAAVSADSSPPEVLDTEPLVIYAENPEE